MPWYWIVIIISAIIGPFEAMHALNKARRKREERKTDDAGPTIALPRSRITRSASG